MSYILLYVYKINKDNVQTFLDICAATREKYIQYGGEAEEVYQLGRAPKQYGLNTIDEALDLNDHEQLWIGLVRFRSEEHARTVMGKFDRDDEVNRLYEQFITAVTPLNKITFGEFVKRDY